jgi:hypothetical protein
MKVSLLLLLCAPVLVFAQIPPARTLPEIRAEVPASGRFSAAILLAASTGQNLSWRPGWPVTLPPDLFVVSGDSGELAVSMDGSSSLVLELSGSNGRKFPVFMDGFVFQAASSSGRITFGGGFVLETLQADEESRPTLVRILLDNYYFVTIVYNHVLGLVEETWYDQDGGPLYLVTVDPALPAVLRRVSFTSAADTGAPEPVVDDYAVERNSYGLISRISAPWGIVSALYQGSGLPRYVEQQTPDSPETARYSFQWDEAGRLVSLSGADPAVEYRYEYELDRRGNWIERREIIMENNAGYLVPRKGITWRRRISYTATPGAPTTPPVEPSAPVEPAPAAPAPTTPTPTAPPVEPTAPSTPAAPAAPAAPAPSTAPTTPATPTAPAVAPPVPAPATPTVPATPPVEPSTPVEPTPTAPAAPAPSTAPTTPTPTAPTPTVPATPTAPATSTPTAPVATPTTPPVEPSTPATSAPATPSPEFHETLPIFRLPVTERPED